MSEESNPLGDLSVDQNNLYREETFTDLKIASIRRLTPVTVEGADDPARPTMFVGEEMFFGQDRLDYVERALE